MKSILIINAALQITKYINLIQLSRQYKYTTLLVKALNAKANEIES